jgi:multimeric flavodoxin WrbA
MNALVLYGSPRKDGSSATLVKHFLQGFNSTGNNTVKEFYANDVKVRPCQGCLTCARLGDNTCATEDDMQQIYSAFVDANIVVWATPMYWGYMTAQLKTILDRMEALACGPEENWKGKTFVAIITYHYHYQSSLSSASNCTPFFIILWARTVEETCTFQTARRSWKKRSTLGKTLQPWGTASRTKEGAAVGDANCCYRFGDWVSVKND